MVKTSEFFFCLETPKVIKPAKKKVDASKVKDVDKHFEAIGGLPKLDNVSRPKRSSKKSKREESQAERASGVDQSYLSGDHQDDEGKLDLDQDS